MAGFKELAESQKVAAQTAAVLKSTGRAAHVTAKGVDDLASSLSEMSGVDDEAIASSENLLLTFTKIRNEAGRGNKIFDQATKAILDMSVAMGTDLNSATIQVGKALNDPIKGITALTRVGVSFDEQTKKQIETLVKHGKTVEAQKIILRELRTEFEGSAEAAGNTLPGQLNKLRNAFEEMAGELVGSLLPAVSTFTGSLSGLASIMQKHTTATKAAVLGIAGFSAALLLTNASFAIYNSQVLVAVKATQALRIALAATPWIAVGLAVGALVVYLINQKRKSDDAAAATRDLTDAVRGYNTAIKEGKDARLRLKEANLQLERSEIQVKRAQQDARRVDKDSHSTLLDRREAELNVAEAMTQRRRAQEAVNKAQSDATGSGIEMTNQLFRQQNAIDNLTKTMQTRWIGAVKTVGNVTSDTRQKMGRLNIDVRKGGDLAAEYADKLRTMAASLANANPKLARTAQLAALLADAWGRVVSLQSAKNFVARFSVFTTVETNRQRPSGGDALGGVVQRGGLRRVHTGERIQPARVARGGQGNGGGGSWQLALVAIGPDLARELQKENTRYARGNGGRSIW